MQSFMLLLNEIFYKAEFNITKSVLETYLSRHPLGVTKGGKSNWFSLCCCNFCIYKKSFIQLIGFVHVTRRPKIQSERVASNV